MAAAILIVILCACVVISMSATSVYAMPAYNGDIHLSQPDGTTFTARMSGDEYFHYYVNEDGTVIQKDQDSKTAGERTKADSSSPPQATTADAAQAADGADDALGKGKPRRDLTQPEVERLLNEARGRERPAGMPHAGNPAGKLAQPDKDW